MAVGYSTRRRAVKNRFGDALPQFGDTYDGAKLRQLVRLIEAPDMVSMDQRVPTITASAGFTITADVVLADAASAPVTVTLPDAADHTDRLLTVKRLNSGANAVTVATSLSQTIDGVATAVLSTQYNSVTLVSNGQHWFKVGQT